MKTKTKTKTKTLCILALAFGPAAVSEVRADEGALSRVMSARQGAIVTVKFILKVKMGGMFPGGGDEESENEINGVMIQPDGVVICSNTQLGGFTAMMKQMMGPMGAGISAVPSDFKILIGDDDEGVEAQLVARDTELDLAWIRIKNESGKTFAYVDLYDGGDAGIGQTVIGLQRMSKYFGRAAACSASPVGGMTTTPRKLLVPSGPVGSLGAPVFLANGKLVGLVVLQMPETGGEDFNPMSMLSQLGDMQDMMNGLILPAASVAKATKRALADEEDEE